MKETINEMMDQYSIKEIDYDDLTFESKLVEKSDWETYKGQWNNQKVCIKKYENVDDPKSMINEITILSNLKHKCIPKFYGVCQEGNTFILVMEFIEGKKLHCISKSSLTDDALISIIKNLADVLQYMHSNNVVQRNLAPDIILWDEKRKIPFIFEFYLSRFSSEDTKSKMRDNNVLYMAPESLDIELDGETVLSNTIDVWAYGCLVSWLYSGHLPWLNKFTKGSVQNKLIAKKEFPIPDEIKDSNIKMLIKMCTQVTVSSRWTIKQVIDFLSTL